MKAAVLLTIALLAAACSASVDSTGAYSESGELIVASGIDAIAEAQGTAHILWFWGAN